MYVFNSTAYMELLYGIIVNIKSNSRVISYSTVPLQIS